MSAIPAIELTCGSDIRPVRALHPVGTPSGPRADEPDLPGDTPDPQHDALAPRRDTPGIRRDTPALRSGRQRDTPAAPLRLTRRGRVVVATAVALLVTVISLFVAGVAQGDEPRPRRRTRRGRTSSRWSSPGPEPVVGGRERGSRTRTPAPSSSRSSTSIR
jgi:hypothetical protein